MKALLVDPLEGRDLELFERTRRLLSERDKGSGIETVCPLATISHSMDGTLHHLELEYPTDSWTIVIYTQAFLMRSACARILRLHRKFSVTLS